MLNFELICLNTIKYSLSARYVAMDESLIVIVGDYLFGIFDL